MSLARREPAAPPAPPAPAAPAVRPSAETEIDTDTSGFRESSSEQNSEQNRARPLRSLARREPWFAFGGRLSTPALIVLGSAAWLLFAGLWQLAVWLELVPPVLLVGPLDVLGALYGKLTTANFGHDIAVSLARILLSFGAASAIAYPCGLCMGTFPVVAAGINPIVAAFRYLPAPSFIPLLLMILGPGDLQKMALLFIGVVFFLITLIADNTRSVAIELVETAATLGATRLQTLRRVILPASLPGAVTALRQMLAVSWTYLVVAEIVAADAGIGAVMVRSQRLLQTDAILACILTIGLLGLASDLAFAAVERLAFPYLRHERARA